MIQKRFAMLGASGCYFFAIREGGRRATGEAMEPYGLFLLANRQGAVGDDGFVLDAGKLMTLSTGLAGWKCEKYGPKHDKPLDTEIGEEEIEVLRYEWNPPGSPESAVHFVLGDGAGNVAYDPYGESLTVKNGKLVSKRVFRRG